jgi:hypothetical protein
LPYRTALSVTLLVTTLLPGCEGSRAPVDHSGPPPSVPGASESSTVRESIEESLQAVKVRQRCNRVMGCAPAVTLMQHGSAAATAITAELERAGESDGYWVPKLVDLLGQLEHWDALPLLHRLLDDRRWEVRARAAQAVGRIGSPESEALIRRHLAEAALVDDVGFHAGLWFALSHCAHAQLGAAQRGMATLLGEDEDRLGQLNPGFFAFAVEVARALRVEGALPAARLAAVHRERSTRLEGMRTLGHLTDTGGIPYVISRLRDPIPTVRAEALVALRQITGIREYTTVDEWIGWCARRKCMASAPRLTLPSSP